MMSDSSGLNDENVLVLTMEVPSDKSDVNTAYCSDSAPNWGASVRKEQESGQQSLGLTTF